MAEIKNKKKMVKVAPKVKRKKRKTITKADLKAVQFALKSFKSDYVPDLVTIMNKAKENKEFNYSGEFQPITIYNIFNGSVKNQLVIASLLKHAKNLLKRYESKINYALNK